MWLAKYSNFYKINDIKYYRTNTIVTIVYIEFQGNINLFSTFFLFRKLGNLVFRKLLYYRL